MTRRRSRREIESAVEDLGGDPENATVREWALAYLGETSGEIQTSYRDTNPDGVRVVAPREGAIWGIECYAPREDVPDWVDVDEDLPVRVKGARGT